MKTKLQHCSKCGEETWHDISKKQAGDRSGKHYIRRTVIRCRGCGSREINNRSKGKRTIIEKDGTQINGVQNPESNGDKKNG